MDLKSIRLAYFSPTGTTRKVLEAVTRGFAGVAVEHLDLTPPSERIGERILLSDRLVVVGSPVYGGRIPLEMISRFRRVRGNDTPAVIVVVYGNRAFEDALQELRDLVIERGFRPIAAGAFIGEHSYSTGDAPVAAGRPDAEDLRRAAAFGAMAHEKLLAAQSLDDAVSLAVPGNFPYKERSGLSNIAPFTNAGICTACGTCAGVCPTAAITVKATAETDPGNCIRCCACVRVCPVGARAMVDPRIAQVREQLNKNCRDRKEPETFF